MLEFNFFRGFFNLEKLRHQRNNHIDYYTHLIRQIEIYGNTNLIDEMNIVKSCINEINLQIRKYEKI